MSICSSGVSGPLPGVPAAVVVDQAYVQSLLPPALAWLYPYLPFMQGLEIGNVGAFCAIDPPTFTVPSGPELFEFVIAGGLSGTGAVGSVDVVNAFLQNITKAYLWYQLCHCTTATTPAPPAAPAAPANLPAVNPPAYVSPTPTSTPCSQYFGIPALLEAGALPVTTSFNDAGGPDVSLIAGVTSMYATYTNVDQVGSPHDTVKATVTFRFPDASVVGTPFVATIARGATVTIQVPIPLGAATWASTCTTTGGVNAYQTLDNFFKFYCNGGGPNGQTGCCPPDPVIKAQIASILDLVTLLQRQAAPFAYIAAAVHVGLTGAGSIAVQGLLGARVSITTDSTTLGVEGTSPPELFGRGWVTFATADGALHSTRIEHPSQLILPCDAGVYTLIYYDLNPLITISITELVREP